MWHAMFVEQIPLAEKVLHVVIVYALIAVLFRLTGKRGLASLSTFDFVVIFLLSNVVQNAVIGNDTSLIGGDATAPSVACEVGDERRARGDAPPPPLAPRAGGACRRPALTGSMSWLAVTA